MSGAMHGVDRTPDPFAHSGRRDVGADPQPALASFIELHREWAAVQQEWVDLELADRAAYAGTDLATPVHVFVDGIKILAEQDVARLPLQRRRVAQRALRAAKRKRKRGLDDAGITAIAARMDAVAKRADVLLGQLEQAPVRSLGDVAALLDAAIDYGVPDVPGVVGDPAFRRDGSLLWKLIESLVELTGHDFGSLRRKAQLGPPLDPPEF